jgi:ubiquitin C-terminal hydrolase
LYIKFILGKNKKINNEEEIKTFNDIIIVDVEDSYDNLSLKTLEFMKLIMQEINHFSYFMHVDDDSFVRIDLLLDLLKNKPRYSVINIFL